MDRDGLLSILGFLLLAGCEDAEAKARYVKSPLESADLTDRTAWSHAAVSEARTRLASVRNDRLGTDLSKEIDDAHDRALEQIREIERNEAATRQAERELQAERERAAAAHEEERRRAAERKYQDGERKRAAERKRDARPEPSVEEPSPAHAAHQAERRRGALERHRERAKEAVTDLEVGIRNSLLNDGTKVVVLRNAKPYPVSSDLRCFTRGDTAQKAFSMRIPAGGEKRLGFVQGWCGNFTRGERCEAYVEGEPMWSYTVPED